MNKKKLIRSSNIRERNSLLKTSIEQAEEKISSLWLKEEKKFNLNKIGFYWPKKKEISPLGIIKNLLKRRIECYLPIISTDLNCKVMTYRQYLLSSKLTKNRLGICEPDKGKNIFPECLDIVFTPLVAFDEQGYRIGMGMGFYDFTFKPFFRKKTPKLFGLAYEFQREPSCFPEMHGLKLDGVISPKGFYQY